jgi:hypothetical protein
MTSFPKNQGFRLETDVPGQPPISTDEETVANAVAILQEAFDRFLAKRLWRPS